MKRAILVLAAMMAVGCGDGSTPPDRIEVSNAYRVSADASLQCDGAKMSVETTDSGDIWKCSWTCATLDGVPHASVSIYAARRDASRACNDRLGCLRPLGGGWVLIGTTASDDGGASCN